MFSSCSLYPNLLHPRMSRESNTPADPLRFTPVPLARARHDGWSSDKQVCFIHALARLPSITAAARSVGMRARSAYRLRDRPGAESFARAWDEAVEIGIDRARDTLIDRAIDGIAVPIVRRGRIIGARRAYADGHLVKVIAAATAPHAAGYSALERRIADRHAIREADARLGGPVDWDAPARAIAAETDAIMARIDADYPAIQAALRERFRPRLRPL